MLTIEQLREMTAAVRDCGYLSTYDYRHEGESPAKAERLIAALSAIRAGVYVPDSIRSLLSGLLSLQALGTFAKSRELSTVHSAADTMYAVVHVETAQEICRWWRGEGAYAPLSTSDTESPEPISPSLVGE